MRDLKADRNNSKTGVGRGDRVYVRIPVTLEGKDKKGNSFVEKSTTIVLDRHGACLKITRPMDKRNVLTIATPKGMQLEANVLWVGSEGAKTAGRIGVESPGLADALGFHFPPGD